MRLSAPTAGGFVDVTLLVKILTQDAAIIKHERPVRVYNRMRKNDCSETPPAGGVAGDAARGGGDCGDGGDKGSGGGGDNALFFTYVM